jgi:cellulose synthase/poly-beta-1,6-N-acetylglucosamine synthase-like glycosyltransferase
MKHAGWLGALALAVLTHCGLTWMTARRQAVQARQQPVPGMQPAIDLPFVSVLVPAWREQGTIEQCIETLCKVEYPAWEAIIIAGGPDDTYAAAARACAHLANFRVLQQQPRGKNAALNQGVLFASGRIIVILDADSRVTPGWLRMLVAPFSQGALITNGTYRPLRRTPISLEGYIEEFVSRNIRREVTLQGSGSIAIDREVLEAVGGFPEDVFVGVDWDLNARLAEQGIPRVAVQEALVYTERPSTLAEYWYNEVRWRRAHLSSLFRVSSYFLRDPLTAFVSLYIYMLAWFSALLSLLALVIGVLGRGSLRWVVPTLWGLFATWVLGRRAAVIGQMAWYTRDPSWWKLLWVPPTLLALTFAAIIRATLSLRGQSQHFKGPRSAR